MRALVSLLGVLAVIPMASPRHAVVPRSGVTCLVHALLRADGSDAYWKTCADSGSRRSRFGR